MNLAGLQAMLDATLRASSAGVPPATALDQAAQSVLRMADAYERDGRTFLARGDPVNALAAFLYGLGWLHCGIASGLLGHSGKKIPCPFSTAQDPLPPSQSAKLDEKTERYARLLRTALSSVSPAPDSSSPAHAFALKVRFIAGLYLARGEGLAGSGRQEDALACFSYGHGWLDCGVETGLFAIHANRGIFTVD